MLARMLICLLLFSFAVPAVAQDAAPAPAASAEDPTAAAGSGGDSLWDILAAGGVVGMFILLLSLAAVALVVEHLMTLRESVLMPPGLADDVFQLLSAGKPGLAIERCRQQPSFLAFVLDAGLTESEDGWPAAEKAIEDAMADQSARLFRKIEYLSLIGNIAPMLGLLGTVVGMIFAFREVASTQGAARAADLAEGIYLALVTTVEGLIVAIPALGAFAIFRNRVDQLVAEAAYVAQHVFRPLKRQDGSRRPKTPPAPPAAPPAGAR
jgi:biopolymer transport protein ExbB